MAAVKSTSFTVRAERWEGGWELYVGDIGVTQSATLAGAEAQARDYLATMLGGEPDEYSVSVVAALGGLEKQAAAARAATAAAAYAQEEAAAESRRVARDLRAYGLSVSDVAEVMDISRGRVSQLTQKS